MIDNKCFEGAAVIRCSVFLANGIGGVLGISNSVPSTGGTNTRLFSVDCRCQTDIDCSQLRMRDFVDAEGVVGEVIGQTLRCGGVLEVVGRDFW